MCTALNTPATEVLLQVLRQFRWVLRQVQSPTAPHKQSETKLQTLPPPRPPEHMPAGGKKIPKRRNIAESLLERLRANASNIVVQRDLFAELAQHFEENPHAQYEEGYVRTDLVNMVEEMRSHGMHEDLQELACILLVSVSSIDEWVVDHLLGLDRQLLVSTILKCMADNKQARRRDICSKCLSRLCFEDKVDDLGAAQACAQACAQLPQRRVELL
jgi:hypothetical protein